MIHYLVIMFILDKMRKNIITLFKNEGLGITVDTNLIETDFLD